MSVISSARMLSMVLLVLVCAPLTSLFSVLVSHGFFQGFVSPSSASCLEHKMTNAKNHERAAAPPSDTTTESTGTEKALPSSQLLSPSFQKTLDDPDTTLNELWAALYQESRIVAGYTMAYPQVHHWTILLPWGAAAILTFLPFVLSVFDYLRPSNDHPWMPRDFRNERRLNRLMNALKEHRKVSKEDRDNENTVSNDCT